MMVLTSVATLQSIKTGKQDVASEKLSHKAVARTKESLFDDIVGCFFSYQFIIYSMFLLDKCSCVHFSMHILLLNFVTKNWFIHALSSTRMHCYHSI